MTIHLLLAGLTVLALAGCGSMGGGRAADGAAAPGGGYDRYGAVDDSHVGDRCSMRRVGPSGINSLVCE